MDYINSYSRAVGIPRNSYTVDQYLQPKDAEFYRSYVEATRHGWAEKNKNSSRVLAALRNFR